MYKYSHKLIAYGLLITTCITLAGLSLAAFLDKSKIQGSTFSVGSSDIKLLANLSLDPTGTNLVDEMSGPSFSKIGPNWSDKYLLKIYNNGTSSIEMSSNANYETINDPDELRQLIYVEPKVWKDENGNGMLDSGEEGESLGKKTIVKWKTEGFNLGQIEQGKTKAFILYFSTEGLSETKQGKTGVFDFEFDSISL